ncbi:MAG: lysophospholipid acyltransferase family protein [Pseudomonadota bacterium]
MSMDTAMDREISFTYSTASQRAGRRNFIKLVELCSGQKRLKKLYETYVRDNSRQEDFFDAAIDRLELNVEYDQERLAAVPRTGPVIFIANHPYGVADGIVLTWLAKRARPDVKVMANHVLCQAPEAGDNLLPVDFSGNKQALLTNIRTRKQALAALAQGGSVGIFPGGGVAASETPWRGPAVDPTWHTFLAKLVQQGKATVVPIYFDGQNSRLFQFASHTSYTLRLALFFRETHRLIGSKMRIAIGDPISPDELATIETRDDIVRYLRRRTYELAKSFPMSKRRKHPAYDREFVYPSRLKID